MNKRAFLVLGPESSGTRLMTRLLMAAGCYGDYGHDQRLDDGLPENEPLLVWRRSVPHRHEWPDIADMIHCLRANSYRVSALVMSRDWHSMAISQQQQHTNGDVGQALQNIRLAYGRIFQALTTVGLHRAPYELVNYEALVMRPAGTVKYLFQRLGLPVPDSLPEVYDANAKYYREVEEPAGYARMTIKQGGKVIQEKDFPLYPTPIGDSE